MLNEENVDYVFYGSASRDCCQNLHSPLSVPGPKGPMFVQTSDDHENLDEYVVEKIVSRRRRNGRTEYYIKWKNWPESDSTWEPEENLSCPDILAEFLQEQETKRVENIKKAAKKRAKRSNRFFLEKSLRRGTRSGLSRCPKTEEQEAPRNNDGDSSKSLSTLAQIFLKDLDQHEDHEEELVTGFDKGLEAETIFGALKHNKTVMFLMKWKGSLDLDLVSAEEANAKCPKVVVKFYETKLDRMLATRKRSERLANKESEMA